MSLLHHHLLKTQEKLRQKRSNVFKAYLSRIMNNELKHGCFYYEFMKSSHSYYFLNFQVKPELLLWHMLPVLLDKIKIPVILSPSIVWWLRQNLLRTSFEKHTIISHSFFHSLIYLIKVSSGH